MKAWQPCHTKTITKDDSSQTEENHQKNYPNNTKLQQNDSNQGLYKLLPPKRCGDPSKRSYTHLEGDATGNNTPVNGKCYKSTKKDMYIQNYDFKIYLQHYPTLRDSTLIILHLPSLKFIFQYE